MKRAARGSFGCDGSIVTSIREHRRFITRSRCEVTGVEARRDAMDASPVASSGEGGKAVPTE